MRLPSRSQDATLYMGLDPGTQGAIALVSASGEPVVRLRLSKSTETDVHLFVAEYVGMVQTAMLEKVASRPGQGVVSVFKFGKAYGLLRGILVANSVPFNDVTPGKWQRAMKCLSKGDKNVTKAAAQRLMPTAPNKIVHEDADAWLIAEYCRRSAKGIL